MSDEAAAAEPQAAEAPTSQPASPSPDASTSQQQDLGKRLSDAINQPESSPQRGEPDPDHWAKVAGRQGQQLGDAQKKIAELEARLNQAAAPQKPAEKALGDRLFEDPDGVLSEIAQRAEQQAYERIRKEYGSDLDQARNVNVATRVANENPIFYQLLSDPQTQSRLAEIGQDPSATERLNDPARNQLLAFLATEMVRRMGAQETRRVNAPNPERPENAGLATPSASPAPSSPQPTGPTPEEVKEKGMDWAWEQFIGKASRANSSAGGKL